MLATEWNIPGLPEICTLLLAILLDPRFALLAGNSLADYGLQDRTYHVLLTIRSFLLDMISKINIIPL